MHAWIVIAPTTTATSIDHDIGEDEVVGSAPGIQTLVTVAFASDLNEVVNDILSHWGAHIDRPLDNDPDTMQRRNILNDEESLEGPDSGLELLVFPATESGVNLRQES